MTIGSVLSMGTILPARVGINPASYLNYKTDKPLGRRMSQPAFVLKTGQSGVCADWPHHQRLR